MMNKAVILAAGAGTRMQQKDATAIETDKQKAIAATGIKALIPIDRPFLDYVLGNLADAGFRQICLVIASGPNRIRDYYEQLDCERLSIQFAVQAEALGTANAVLAAESFARSDPFLVINSDNYYPLAALRSLREAAGSATVGFVRKRLIDGSNIPPERIRAFSVIDSGGDGTLKRILEKPEQTFVDQLPEPVLVSMNCWRFSSAIFAACRDLPLSSRGEYELPDAVMCSITQFGEQYRVIRCVEPVLDLSSRRDVESVASRLRGVEVQL
jgi:glucose-1-phosphate thymidylyltransferase